MSVAPALHDLPHIAATPDRPLRALPPQAGSPASKLNAQTRALMEQANTFRRSVAEIRTHLPLPSQRQERIGESAGKLTAALKQAAATFREESQRVARTAATASAVAPYADSMPWHVLLGDDRLASRFFDMEPAQRATTLAEATRNPQSHLRLVEALLRVDPALTGLSSAEHTALRESTLAALQPDLHAAIQAEKTQVAHARQALAFVAQELRDEAPTAWTETQAVDPEIAVLLHGAA